MGEEHVKAQTPAEGITLQAKFKDSTHYRVTCECGNKDCTADICIEYDNDTKDFSIIFDTTQKTHFWKTLYDWEVHKIDNPILYWIINTTQSFINGFHQRLKITYSVWSKGYVEYQSSTILSKQAAFNMVEAVKNSIEELEKK